MSLLEKGIERRHGSRVDPLLNRNTTPAQLYQQIRGQQKIDLQNRFDHLVLDQYNPSLIDINEKEWGETKKSVVIFVKEKTLKRNSS